MNISITGTGYVSLDTYANVVDLVDQSHYKPAATVNDGIQGFTASYREFYGLVIP